MVEELARRVGSVVRLIDVAPTLLAANGLTPLRAPDGLSLLDSIDKDSKLNLEAYSETVYPFRHFHCAPLVSLTTQDYSFVQAPRPELYASKVDFAELHNIAVERRPVVQDLREKLRPFAAAVRNAMAPAPAPETLAKLKSLGYIGGASSATGKLADPKDQIALYRRYQDALELQGSGRIAESVAGLKRVVSADPAIVGARIELGLTLQRLHRDSDAVKEFESALRVDPRNALVHFNLGVSLSNLGNNEKAERELDLATALQRSFSRAFVARGLALARMRKLREGVASLTTALSIDARRFRRALQPRESTGARSQQWDDSRRDLLQAVAIEPDNAAAHEALGTLAIHSGDDSGALREYQQAVALDPRLSTAHSGLGLLYLKLGQKDQASVELRKALELDPNNADARDALKR